MRSSCHVLFINRPPPPRGQPCSRMEYISRLISAFAVGVPPNLSSSICSVRESECPHRPRYICRMLRWGCGCASSANGSVFPAILVSASHAAQFLFIAPHVRHIRPVGAGRMVYFAIGHSRVVFRRLRYDPHVVYAHVSVCPGVQVVVLLLREVDMVGYLRSPRSCVVLLYIDG